MGHKCRKTGCQIEKVFGTDCNSVLAMSINVSNGAHAPLYDRKI